MTEPLRSFDQRAVLPLLRQVFGSQVEICRQETLKQDSDYRVLGLELAHPAEKVVIKLAGPQAPLASPFERTAFLYNLIAAQTALRVPRVLAVDASCREWPWRYLVMNRISGLPWAAVAPKLAKAGQDSALADIGRAAAQLHNLHFPSFGEISPTGVQPPGLALYPALVRHAQAIIQGQEYLAFFLTLLERERALFEMPVPACLCHEDLHQYNLLFEQVQGRWQLATVVDFDKAWAGPAESDLGRLEVWRGMTSPAFWDAYQQAAPLSPEYARRRPIYQLLWCLEYAEPSRQHNADTRRVCQELGVQLPRAFGPGA